MDHLSRLSDLELDEKSLMLLMKFILKNLEEERELALKHHDSLSVVLEGSGADLNDINMSMLVKEFSNSLTGLIGTAQKSTAEMIKIAKIISDVLIKISNQDPLSEQERESFQNLLANSEDLLNDLETDNVRFGEEN